MFKLEVKTGNAAFRDESRTDRHGDYVLTPTLPKYAASCWMSSVSWRLGTPMAPS